MTPWGADDGRLSRTPESIELKLDHPHLPDVRFHEVDGGRVRLDLRRAHTCEIVESLLGTLTACAGSGRVTLRFRSAEGPLEIVLTL